MNRPIEKAARAALGVVSTLRESGHVALLAGGCVRDRLLRLTPKDYDVATDAVPERVLELFPRSRKVGAQFGVVLVRSVGCDIEVATFRADGPYSDGRRPDSVRFGTEVDDARRRDFTINGLYWDPVEDRIIDHVGGRDDLAAGLIRTIGDPAARFAEDHLRMIRAVRFAARLAFRIDPATRAAIQELAHQLTTVSPERVWMELEQILTSPSRASGWSLLLETGLRPYLSPSWPTDSKEDPPTTLRLGQLPPRILSSGLALAAVLCAAPAGKTGSVCQSFRLSNQLSRNTCWLARKWPVLRDEPDMELADLKILMADQNWPDLLDLLRAELVVRATGLQPYQQVLERSVRIPSDQIAPPPLLNGNDISAMGVPPGPAIGKLLERVYRAQLNEEIQTHEHALELAQRLLLESKGTT